MRSLEIKFKVIDKWGSITAGAKALETSRSALSYCISKKRRSPELREKLARELGMTVEELFGDSSSTKGSDRDSEPEGET